MKKIIKSIFILSLSIFSFFYTDKVINLINRKDPLMIELVSVIDDYQIISVDAVINQNTIIPGIKGKEVDLDKSYQNMKKGAVFREDALVYKEVSPNNSIKNNKNKYIIKGNSIKKEVSILYIVDKEEDIEKIKNIKDITLFIESNYLTNRNIKLLNKNEIYSYGKSGTYSDTILKNDSSLINKLSNNRSIYCLSKEENKETLTNCNANDMYVVIPNIIGGYSNIKKELSNGSVILLDDIDDINIISKYIKGKGYNIVYLSNLLEE